MTRIANLQFHVREKLRQYRTLPRIGKIVASAVGAVYDRALFFSSITRSGCYEKSCAVIDRAYSGSCLENVARLGVSFDFADG
jgi:hypothetical protein